MIERWMMKKTALAILMTGIVLAGATRSDSALTRQGLPFQSPVPGGEQTARVPEPATMFLFGTGLIALSAFFRRKNS
ncbi:PEP-CTERM sorting domain-containing protein [Desulfobulbus propionicus]|jgi:hypothetical protein